MKLREKANHLYEKAKTICSKLSRSQKFFVFGAIFALLAVFLWMTPFAEPFFIALFFSGLLFVSGVVSDLLYLYGKVWATTIGKSLQLLLYALASTVAYAVAAQIINGVVAYDSSNLTRAVTFVAILLVPLFVFASTYLIFAILFILGQFYFLLVMHAEALRSNECLKSIIPYKLEEYPGWTSVARLIIYPVTVGFLWGSAGHFVPIYGDFVGNSAAKFVFHLEAMEHTRCSIPEGTKAIPVNNKEIILATRKDGKYYFKAMACEARI